MEVSADSTSPGHPSGCRCPLEDPPFSSPEFPSFPPEDQGWGLMPTWSWECSAPAVGSAKLAGHPVGHGPHQSPTAPAITGRLWNGENSTSAQLPDFSISDGPALQPALLAPLPWPWDAQALAIEALTLSLPLEAPPTTMRMPEGNSPLLHPRQGPAYTAALGSLLPGSDPAQAIAFLLHGLGLQPLHRKRL